MNKHMEEIIASSTHKINVDLVHSDELWRMLVSFAVRYSLTTQQAVEHILRDWLNKERKLALKAPVKSLVVCRGCNGRSWERIDRSNHLRGFRCTKCGYELSWRLIVLQVSKPLRDKYFFHKQPRLSVVNIHKRKLPGQICHQKPTTDPKE